MKNTTITWIIGSIAMMGVSAATSDYWFLPVLWGLSATMWGFTAGMEHADKAWRGALWVTMLNTNRIRSTTVNGPT